MKDKNYLLVEDAVAEGYFSSPKQASELRSRKEGPPWSRPTKGRIYYKREDLEAWMRRARVITKDALTWEQRSGRRSGLPGRDWGERAEEGTGPAQGGRGER